MKASTVPVAEEASFDFGGVIHRVPSFVHAPTSVDEVREIVRDARRRGVTLRARGAGHSQGGQALTEGEVLRSAKLDSIEAPCPSSLSVRVGTGARWGDVARLTWQYGLLPPVMTDHPGVSIGGTLSVAGLGPASYRLGSQGHHCLDIEAVTGTGDVLRASREKNKELFDGCLGGLGQIGVMTSATLSLTKSPRFVHTFELCYRDVTSLIRESDVLMAHPEVAYLQGARVPGTTGDSYHLLVSHATNEETWDPSTLCKDIESQPAGRVVRRDSLSFATRLEHAFPSVERPLDERHCHPWVEFFLPADKVEAFATEVFPRFPQTPALIWPMRTAALNRPFFSLPSTPTTVLVGLLVSCPPQGVPTLLGELGDVDAIGHALGGVRYLSGWLDFDPRRWRDHYGDDAKHLIDLKRRWDPDNVFGALPFSSE